MIITCDQCSTRFRLDEAGIPDTTFRAKCSKCGHNFLVEPPRAAEKNEPVLLSSDQIVPEKEPCKTISICNQKGGVGKTTTCMNLGASLAELGFKVLLIDFDVQANLSILQGCRGRESFFDVLDKNDSNALAKSILKVRDNIWILPSNSRMALMSKRFLQTQRFEYILKDHLRKLQDFFDFILIDTPPSIDFFTINALIASDMAVIPTQSEFLAVNGVRHIENMIRVIGEKTGHKVDFRVLATMFDRNNTAATVILNKLQKQYPQHMFETLIDYDEQLQESQISRTPVLVYARDSSSAVQYLALSKELIRR